MASDFHSHRPKSAARTLVSCRAEELPYYPLASLELHPWFLPERFEPFSAAFRAAARTAAAIGEAGLDRLRGPSFEVQVQYLDALLELAVAEAKPVVLHCVRAVPELLAAVKRHPGTPCLFHGLSRKAGTAGGAAETRLLRFAQSGCARQHAAFRTSEADRPRPDRL